MRGSESDTSGESDLDFLPRQLKRKRHSSHKSDDWPIKTRSKNRSATDERTSILDGNCIPASKSAVPSKGHPEYEQTPRLGSPTQVEVNIMSDRLEGQAVAGEGIEPQQPFMPTQSQINEPRQCPPMVNQEPLSPLTGQPTEKPTGAEESSKVQFHGINHTEVPLSSKDHHSEDSPLFAAQATAKVASPPFRSHGQDAHADAEAEVASEATSKDVDQRDEGSSVLVEAGRTFNDGKEDSPTGRQSPGYRNFQSTVNRSPEEPAPQPESAEGASNTDVSDQKPAPQPSVANIQVCYTIIKSRQPRLNTHLWVDGGLSNRTVLNIFEDISKLIGRPTIEQMNFKLSSFSADHEAFVRQGDQRAFSAMRERFKRQIRLDLENGNSDFDIYLEPDPGKIVSDFRGQQQIRDFDI